MFMYRKYVQTVEKLWLHRASRAMNQGIEEEADEEDVEEDGEKRSRKGGAVDLFADEARVERDLDEDKGELADLRETESDGEGRPDGVAEKTNDGGPDEQFSEDDEKKQDKQEGKIAEEEPRVDERADGDEEEGDEGVAERKHLHEGLVGVVGGANGQTGEKRTEGERKADTTECSRRGKSLARDSGKLERIVSSERVVII